MYVWYIPQYEHMTNKRDTYKDFYDKLNSNVLNIEDKCELCRIKLRDREDGLNISDAIIQTAKEYLAKNCDKNGPKFPKKIEDPSLNRPDINPKNKDSIENTFKRYCQPKFGNSLKDIPFDNYTIETDENGNYLLNGTIINKIEINKNNCRRIEEYIKNQSMQNINNNNENLSIDNLYSQCLVEYNDLGKTKKDGYNYYLSRDGKYYLNNEPLDRIKLTKMNCEIIKDIKNQSIKSEDKSKLTFNLVDELYRDKICKKMHEYDYICSVYDKQKILDYGKERNVQPEIYQYPTGPDPSTDFEYSFLKPDEYLKVIKNIKNGKSGLTADNEIDLCYRKGVIEKQCSANSLRSNN